MTNQSQTIAELRKENKELKERNKRVIKCLEKAVLALELSITTKR